ncbi:hypothetical protein A1O3_01060 [Capronia epimyces CBS 606.96]|uniref:Protein YAE1 n=1 Tax=Capronia epimyces CBS 606.96 TaxID=1182542 RepID=W9YIZ9_9EURO|nr:uncharacterized protein A1O3_01060 [Capronia epimyces CBS 606.96]EXJ92508.1 hypothetical protein A1O3_01060 [Capronia epimyces CBS 606.96]
MAAAPGPEAEAVTETLRLSMSHSSEKSSPPGSSASTTVTTPEQSPGADDDIWDTSSDYHDHDAHAHAHNGDVGHDGDGGSQFGLDPNSSAITPRPPRAQILSDIPSLRRQHMTDGYREGLGVGKARVMQAGFDAGYPFGVEIGMRVGQILGVLEGVVSAATATSTTSTTTSTNSGRGANVGRRGGLVGSDDGVSSGLSFGTGSVSMSHGSNAASGSESTQTASARIAASGQASVERDVAANRGSRGGDTDTSAVEVQFVHRLYERAKIELKISELLKVLDDTRISELQNSHQIDDDVLGEEENISKVQSARQKANQWDEVQRQREEESSRQVESTAEEANNQHQPRNPGFALPHEIETVLAKWEKVVLGSLS